MSKEINRIIMPKQLPEKVEDRRLLGDFYDTFCTKEWFRGAELVENHPTHMRKTIVVKCDYKPTIEMNDIINFAHEKQVAVDWNIIKPDEQPTYNK